MIKKIYHGIIFILVISLFFCSYPLAFILYGRKKYWLISEVDFDARDNGMHFFKYLNDKHKDINSVYLISKKNPNYQKMKDIGKTIEPHSYRHMLVFISAKAKISTLVHGCSPSWCVTKYLLKHHGTGKNIALKHGIFKNLHPNYFKRNAHLDLICCGAKPEFEFINKEFGYENGVAQYTGLARFDNLHNLDTKKEILVMPTWRRWLDSVNSCEEFEQSDYYKNWHSLLSNKEFIKLATDNGLDICFYVHPKLNRFISSFSELSSGIRFLNSKEGDSVQLHLRDALLLITDFSSVFFDFAYARKPSIYYQFDENRYYESHYIKAYFDYRENGFGPVVCDEDSVVREVYDTISNKFKMGKKYLKNANDFFPFCDNNNCERIFRAIYKQL